MSWSNNTCDRQIVQQMISVLMHAVLLPEFKKNLICLTDITVRKCFDFVGLPLQNVKFYIHKIIST